MKLTHLGHESWHIKSTSANLLIDPILRSSFGTNRDLPFTFVPKVEIDSELYKDVNSVVITAEYFQHFDPLSLKLLQKGTEVIVSSFFSKEAKEFIIDFGLQLTVLRPGKVYKKSGFELIFFPPDNESVIWDSRVVSLGISFCNKSSNKTWHFFQSDTMILKSIKDFVPNYWCKFPATTALTSHIKFYSEKGFIPYDNYIEDTEVALGPVDYFDFLSTIIPVSTDPINMSRCFFLCGGGYDLELISRPKTKYDNKHTVSILERFTLNSQIFSPVAGEVFKIEENNISKIESTKHINISQNSIVTERQSFTPHLLFEKDIDLNNDDEKLLKRCFEYLGKVFLFSQLGESLIFTSNYLESPCDAKRFCIQFFSSKRNIEYVFDFSMGEFIEEEFSEDLAITKYPSGVRMYLNDFIEVIYGHVTIAEVCHAGAIHWHTGNYKESPIGLLYTAFAEFMPNGLAKKKYSYIKKSINDV